MINKSNHEYSNTLYNKTILPLTSIESYLDSLAKLAKDAYGANSPTGQMAERWAKEAKNSLDISLKNCEIVIEEMRKI